MLITIIVQNLTAPTRADKFLAEQYSTISRTQIKKSFDIHRVVCNGNIIQPKHLLNNQDILEFDLILPSETTISPYNMPLEILFEDEHIIVINKPIGKVTHLGNGITDPTLVEGILSHCKLSNLGGSTRPGVVHRLDKDTTGAIMFAKTDEAYLKAIKMFTEHTIKKQYLALICGTFELFSGTIDRPIGRHKTLKTKMCIRDDGRSAQTDWAVLETFGKKFSLLQVWIRTGRTHQIRVHLSSIGRPILGDLVYGYNPNFDQRIIAKHPFLHAQKLQFSHPITQEELSINAPLPKHFQDKLQEIKKFYKSL